MFLIYLDLKKRKKRRFSVSASVCVLRSILVNSTMFKNTRSEIDRMGDREDIEVDIG